MKHSLKLLFFLSLIFSFFITSCDSDNDDKDEDFSGISIATTRSNAESEGIGIACNFGKIIKEHLEDEDFDELFDELKEDEDEKFDSEKFDEFLDKIFGNLKTMYVVVAGDDIDFENKEGVAVEGEAFSISWFSDTDEPEIGIYEAEAVKINITDPEDLEEGAEFSGGKITVELTELTDEVMVGTFSGTIENKEGEVEDINGEFNVERESCEKE